MTAITPEVRHTEMVISKVRYIITTTIIHDPEAVEAAAKFAAQCLARRIVAGRVAASKMAAERQS